MDKTRKALIAGQSGCGKSTLLKAWAARESRTIHWDVEDEYKGELVTLADIPGLFKRKAFTVVYRPRYARLPEHLPREFAALAYLLLEFGKDCLVTIDEATTVLQGNKSGGLGSLLLRGRKRGLSLIYATQYVSLLPGVLISQAHELVLFRLDGRGDQQVLRSYLDQSTLRRVAALPPHEFVLVKK